MKKPKHRYIIRKYIVASSAKEAIKLEKKAEVDEVYVDQKDINSEIGFKD